MPANDVRALKTAAAQKLREGDYAGAAELFAQLTQIEPREPNHWFNLGYSRRMARDYAGALDAYAEALKRGVSGAEDVHVNRAVILSEYLHDTPAAAAELQKAVAANPRGLSAWLNLGSLREDLGNADGAREAYEAALRINPGSGRAVARLAAIDLHESGAEAGVQRLRDAVQRQWPTNQDAAEVHFALGNALDAAGDYRGAFAAIAEGNRRAHDGRPSRALYDANATEALVDALIALRPTDTAGPIAADQTPIFICGMFRSGSTLVEQLLARHSQVAAGGELEFIPAMVHEDLSPYPQSLVDASRERLGQLQRKYLEQLRRLLPGAGRVTDKRPDNFLHIALIKALFPQARIVHTRRRPLDNVLSVYFLYFGDDVRYSDSLDDIAHFYIQYRRLMDHWQARFEPDIHAVDYDALVADPRGELEPLLGFLGLDWEDSCLTPETRDAVRTASNWQVRQPLHRRSSGRWRNYTDELDGVRRRLVDAGLADAEA